jgi:hypothetical protein
MNLLYFQTSSDKLKETDLWRTKREDSAKENQNFWDQKRCAILLPRNPFIKSQRVHEAFGIQHLIQILMNDSTFRDERKWLWELKNVDPHQTAQLTVFRVPIRIIDWPCDSTHQLSNYSDVSLFVRLEILEDSKVLMQSKSILLQTYTLCYHHGKRRNPEPGSSKQFLTEIAANLCYILISSGNSELKKCCKFSMEISFSILIAAQFSTLLFCQGFISFWQTVAEVRKIILSIHHAPRQRY